MKGIVKEQPQQYPVESMDLYKDFSKVGLLTTESNSCNSRHSGDGECCERGGHGHRNCHKSRRRFLFLVFGILFLLGLFVAGFCAYRSCISGGASGFSGSAASVLGGLVKRATGDAQGDDGGVFIDRKYYLIIIFVGLFLVVILAIMLSAWCCRGAFENPLCCPCYLCACCGGLACLECIGCGLCAEAADL